jgi:hypothetical protein
MKNRIWFLEPRVWEGRRKFRFQATSSVGKPIVYKTLKLSNLFTWVFKNVATLICCACLFFCYFYMSCSFLPCVATLLFPHCVGRSHLTLLFCCFHLALLLFALVATIHLGLLLVVDHEYTCIHIINIHINIYL